MAALLVLAANPAIARAQDCADAERRLSFVRDRLHQDEHDARVWGWSWGLGFTALALGQGGFAFTRTDRGERAELFVGAGKSALGLIPLLLAPVPAVRDAVTLDERLATSITADDRCALLPEAERLLRRSADDEAFSRGWLAHTLAVAVNGGGLLILGLRYQRWPTAMAGALIGTAVAEVQIFTRPTAALRGQRAYQSRWLISPLLQDDALGIQFAGLLGD